MARPGQIIFDYKQLWMDFDYNGARLRLHWGVTPHLSNHLRDYTEVARAESQAELMLAPLHHVRDHIKKTTQKPSPTLNLNTPPSFVYQLQTLLTSYTDIFSSPTRL